jgi:tetratricopeptide (TPR) repeat protein
MRQWPQARATYFCATVVLVASALLAASGRDALEQAALLVQKGRLAEAERQARLALADPETRAVGYSVLGTIRVHQKKFAESALFLRKAIRLEPQLVGAHLTLAQVYALQGKSDSALGMFRRVLELDSTNAIARLALAQSATEKGRYAESLELVRPVMAAIAQRPDGLFVLVADLLKTGDRASATQLVNQWARVPDASRELSLKLALLLIDEKMVPDAIAVLEQARQSGPPSFDLAFNLGGAYLLNGDLPRALDAYDAALALNSQSQPALQQAAAVAEKHGELERSLSYWIRARKMTPEDPEVLLGFGRVCLKMDLLQDAEPALEKAAALKPGELSYQYALAAAKVGKRQFEEAQVLLEALLSKRPDDPHLLYGLGAVFYSEGRLADAAVRLEESVRRQPDQLAARYYLALIARDQGRDAEAIEMLEALLQRYPDDAASSEALGGLLMSAQRFADAEARLRTAVRLNPQSVKANYQLGLLLARTGRKEEGDKQLALSKELRQEDEATSRLQLRLLEPEQ